MVVLLGACRDRLAHIAVARVVIDAPRELDERRGLRDALQKHAQEVLKADADGTWESKPQAATHLLALTLLPDGGASSPGRSLQVILRPTDKEPLFGASAPIPAGDGIEVFAQAFAAAWHLVGLQRKMEAAGTEALLPGLGASQRAVRAFAIARLGELRTPEAVVPLCKLLTDEEDEGLVLRAIGSLVAIGDTRAVEPLIELTRRREAPFVLQVVFAVGAIGGRTAEAFLVTLASGHPSKQVQRGAKDALREMEQRQREEGKVTAATP